MAEVCGTQNTRWNNRASLGLEKSGIHPARADCQTHRLETFRAASQVRRPFRVAIDPRIDSAAVELDTHPRPGTILGSCFLGRTAAQPANIEDIVTLWHTRISALFPFHCLTRFSLTLPPPKSYTASSNRVALCRSNGAVAGTMFSALRQAT